MFSLRKQTVENVLLNCGVQTGSIYAGCVQVFCVQFVFSNLQKHVCGGFR